jgi:hypothetical protein
MRSIARYRKLLSFFTKMKPPGIGSTPAFCHSPGEKLPERAGGVADQRLTTEAMAVF